MTAVVGVETETVTVRGKISKAEQVRNELGAIWHSYCCLIPVLISGGDAKTKSFTTKFDESVIALKKAKEGIFKEGDSEYLDALAVARALMSEIAAAIHEATEGKAILIT